MTVKVAVPALSVTTVSAFIATPATSSSVIVPVAVGLLMVTSPPVILVMVARYVSVGSTRSSSVIETVKVLVAPLVEPAGKVRVPLAVV